MDDVLKFVCLFVCLLSKDFLDIGTRPNNSNIGMPLTNVDMTDYL